MQGAAQPVLGLRALTDQARAVRDEASQLAHVLRRDPHRRNESCRQESGQVERIARIGFHPGGGNQFRLPTDEPL
jgi:hypothetical protein